MAFTNIKQNRLFPFAEAYISASSFNASGSNTTTTGTIYSGNTSLEIANATGWTVGMGIAVQGSGTGSVDHITTITSISGTTFTLAAPAVVTQANTLIYHDDTAALQAAVDYCHGSGANTHGNANCSKNLPLYIPNGNYNVTSPILLLQLVGGMIVGGGRFTTSLHDRSGNGIFATNGCAYSYFAHMTLWGNGKGNGSVLFALGWDNTALPVAGNALQSNTFENISFLDATMGLDVGCGYNGSSGYMGSETLLLNCFFGSCTTGAKTNNFNCVQNHMVGGNVQGCEIGLYAYQGTWSAHAVSFQNQTAISGTTGVDVRIDNNATDGSAFTACRTETNQFILNYGGQALFIGGCNQVDNIAPSANDYFLSQTGGAAVVSGCITDAGQITGSQAMITVSNFICYRAANDGWLSVGSSLVQAENIRLPMFPLNIANRTYLAGASGIAANTPWDGAKLDILGPTGNPLNITWDTAPPSGIADYHFLGERVINSVPSVGQPKSWVCTVAGAPGTWVSEGNL